MNLDGGRKNDAREGAAFACGGDIFIYFTLKSLVYRFFTFYKSFYYGNIRNDRWYRINEFIFYVKKQSVRWGEATQALRKGGSDHHEKGQG